MDRRARLPPGFYATKNPTPVIPEEEEEEEDWEKALNDQLNERAAAAVRAHNLEAKNVQSSPSVNQSQQPAGPSADRLERLKGSLLSTSINEEEENPFPANADVGLEALPPNKFDTIRLVPLPSYTSGPIEPTERNESGKFSLSTFQKFFSQPLGRPQVDKDNKDASQGRQEIEQESMDFVRRRRIDRQPSMRNPTFVECTDPMCNICPPEMHLNRRKWNKEQQTTFDTERELEEFQVSSDPYAYKDASSKSWWSIPQRCFQNVVDPVLALKGVLNPHSKFVKTWMQIFLITLLLSFAIDPMFFYTFSYEMKRKCLYIQWPFAAVLAVLRTLTDACYWIHIFIQFRLAYVQEDDFEEESVDSRVRVKSIKVNAANRLVSDPHLVASHYLRTTFLLDLVAALPLPQVVMFALVPPFQLGNSELFWKTVLRMAILLQLIPRCIRFFRLLTGVDLPSAQVFETAWARFTLNILLYIMCSHIIGCLWYLFTVQRVALCLHRSCLRELTCRPEWLICNHGLPSSTSFHESIPRTQWEKSTDTTNACMFPDNAINSLKTMEFSYGIYTSGVQLLYLPRTVSKIFYSLAWGFSQISTLGGQLVFTTFLGEIFFSMVVIAMGLLLFAMLISNMQNHLQSLGRRSFDYQLRLRDVEGWMNQRNLPPKLQRRIRELERLQWAAYKGVDEEQIISTLTDDIQRDIRRHLCLELVNKSMLFKNMDEQVLDAICERLHQRLYVTGTQVIRQGFLVSRMFFVLRGELRSTTRHHDKGNVSTKRLSKGDFFGEELLVLFLDRYTNDRRLSLSSSSSMRKANNSEQIPFPKSECTVECMGPVEGFSLESSDLEFVCSQFYRELHTPELQKALNIISLSRRTRAALIIQVAWRQYVRRLFKLTFSDVFNAAKTRRMGKVIRDARAVRQLPVDLTR